ncbi:MAG: 4Fe-4S cluster-binding domain-containing protein [Patescibacteria group bacterium]
MVCILSKPSKQSLLDEIKSKKLPVVIAGAGVVGKTLLSICKDNGIEVECFCDNSKKVAEVKKFCGLEVIYTPDLKKKYKNAIVLISVASIKDTVDLLHNLGFFNWYAGGLLLKDFDVSQNSDDASLDYAKFAIENCILCHDGYLNPDKLFLRSIDVVITECCSLKCKDCSNLMQYYENPKNCDIGMLLKSLDAFCAIVDEVMDFRVIGGEPFVNKEWYLIVRRLVAEPKAKRVVIYTNGTIVPDKKHIPLLKNKKVLVIISDYGTLSKKLSELKQVLEENKIAHHVLKITEWLDCSAIAAHNRGVRQNKEIFRVCCAKNMATLFDGKLYRCPYSANADRLAAIPDCKSDYVDIMHEPISAKNIRAIKNKVKRFLLYKEYLKACDFCNGRPLSGVEVPPSAQIEKPLKYRKYSE